MQRVARIAGSFAVVTVTYWLYAMLAVPWIEPPAKRPSGGGIADGNRPKPGELVKGQLKQLAWWFNAGDWELTNPKILESDHAKLLLQDYRNLGDGRVEIRPCTIIFPYEGPAEDEAQRRRQAVILQAPQGAMLQFDQPFDLHRAKIGRLVAGQFKGQITIRSDGKCPGSEDDLLITTRDVELTERTVATPQPVDFRWGPNYGRGHQMLMKLLAGEARPATEVSGPNVAGVESFELRRVERLHLDLGAAMASPGKPAASTPVEITCRGPFRFDVVRRVATFSERVEVMKRNPQGPGDQILCDVLSLCFIQRPKGPKGKPGDAAPPAPKNTDAFDLVAQRIEARGNPVIVSAPSQTLTARGQRLEYDLLAKSLALDGQEEVMLQQGPNEIHARGLQYQSAEPGRLGRVLAQGPGWLRGETDPQKAATGGLAPENAATGGRANTLEALWKEQLRVYPQEQNQVIALNGGAELRFRGVGQLNAQEIFFWLAETPPAVKTDQPRLRPDRMLARKDVRLNSPQLSSQVEQLEVWFQEGVRVQGSGVSGEERGENTDNSRQLQAAGGSAQSPGTALPGVGPLAPAAGETPPSQRFEVVGRMLRARVLLQGQQAAISNLTIEDGVRFLEIQTARADERPLLIRGDRLEVVDADKPHATVAVTGKPARFEGRGLGLTGPNIHLDRGANRLWIDGGGRMDLPLAGDLQGKPLPVAGVLTVDWRRRMQFDGSTARFEESVVANAQQQQLRTETMEIKLQQPIRFGAMKTQQQPQVEQILCQGGVTMESRTLDQQQQLSAYERLEVTDLAVNLLSGALMAGPGWLNSVRRGSDDVLGNRAAAAAGNPAAATPAAVAAADQLNCLHVRFQKSITGNLLRRQLSFSDQVQAAYAPVTSWDAMLPVDNPDVLGPKGVTVRCDQLSVAEMFTPMGNRRSVELEALGNTVVEGTTFTARGNRITYAEAKDLLVLEGDGRSDAELFRQPLPGVPTSKAAARKILYWPKTNRLKVDGARSLELSQFPGGNGKQ
jgi:lipopolysaccharide export system protein LptA